MGQQQATQLRVTTEKQSPMAQVTSVPPLFPHSASDTIPQDVSYDSDSPTVPVMFKWTHGGQRVFLTGTFNNWAREGIPMVRSGQEFYQIIEIPKGLHEYKFLVDGEWKFSLDQPVLQDVSGNVNNVVDIQYYERYEPAPLQDPLDVEDESQFTTEVIDPATTQGPSEPPYAPPLLLRLPLMGLPCARKGETLKCVSSNVPSTAPTVNIPFFAIAGHLSHDANVTFRQMANTDTVLVSACIRFAQKFSTSVLATLNNSTVPDGLQKHYGLSRAAEIKAPHLFLKALTGKSKPIIHSVSLNEIMGSSNQSTPALFSTPRNSGILKRPNSGASRFFDIYSD